MSKMVQRLAAGAAIALVLGGAAAAGDWRLAALAGEADGATLGVDLQSFRGPEHRRMALVVQVFPSTQGAGDVEFDYLVSELEVNCAARTYGFRRLTAYTLDGLATGSETSNSTQPIVDNSTMSGAEVIICQGERSGAGFAEAQAFARASRAGQLDDGPPPNQT